jgi:4-methyl-5(b-hydroxyethyl)-thiazole monophosphate biosynthesis
MAKALVFLAEGFEEVEALTPIDYLRRAHIEVTSCSLQKRTVQGSHAIPVIADCTIEELLGAGTLSSRHWDAVILPGGMPGARNLAGSRPLGDFIKDMAGAGRLVAAICASPALVLLPLGVLQGCNWTCYPGMEAADTGWKAETVVIDKNVITSRAAGTAAQWALAIIATLSSTEIAQSTAASLLL